MSVVNNILNMVKLNTTDYNKKLQKMKKDTKRDTKSIGSSFSSMASAWKAALVGIASASLVSSVKKELEATERSVAGFISSFGGVDQARAQFEMLQQAARDTIQPFDSLQTAAMNLKRNGVQPTADMLKTFSQIAYGTGQSLDTVTNAFTSSMQGRYKALNQLGITAQDQGSKLALTYKGVTTTIDKSAESLHKYFETVGKENEGVLDYLQSGMTGALNHLDNAWGDFIRSIGESGLGDAIAHTIRAMSTALDGITAWINNNQAAIKQFFYNWSDYVDRLAKDFEGLTRDLNNFFNASQKVNGARGKSAPGVLGYINSFAETIGETWHDLINGGDAERAFKAEREREIALFKQKTANLKKGSAEYERAIYETNERQKAIAKKYEKETTSVVGRLGDFLFGYEKFSDRMDKNLNAYSEYLDKQNEKREEAEKKARERSGGADVSLTPFGTGGGSGGGGRGSAIRAEADNWAKYYDKVKDLAKNGLSDLRKLEARHDEQLAELDEEFKKSRLATESEYLNAKKIINDEYMRQYQDIQKQAQEFLKDIYDDDVVNLQDTYRAKLEQLAQYHDESLVSEEDYLKAREKLYTDYTAELNKIEKENRGSVLSKDDVENLEHFHDAMDSMSDAFSNLTQGLNESSASYKALFTIQKSFAVASATVKAALAWMTALSESKTWYEALANYATAISLTTSVISQLKSVSMHDKGGYIKGGQLGIVGEYGPEIVRGPASVTSRKDTAAMAMASMGGSSVTVNLYEDRAKAGQVEQSSTQDGEQIINIFVSNIRKGGQIAQTMESTYALRRYGA